jgi:hypothetical protein
MINSQNIWGWPVGVLIWVGPVVGIVGLIARKIVVSKTLSQIFRWSANSGLCVIVFVGESFISGWLSTASIPIAPNSPDSPYFLPQLQNVSYAFNDLKNLNETRVADIQWLAQTGLSVGSGCELNTADSTVTFYAGKNCKFSPKNPVTRGTLGQLLQKLAGRTDQALMLTYQNTPPTL